MTRFFLLVVVLASAWVAVHADEPPLSEALETIFLEEEATGEPQDCPSTRPTCCGGRHCEFEGGVCCGQGDFCCPQGSECIAADKAGGKPKCGILKKMEMGKLKDDSHKVTPCTCEEQKEECGCSSSSSSSTSSSLPITPVIASEARFEQVSAGASEGENGENKEKGSTEEETSVSGLSPAAKTAIDNAKDLVNQASAMKNTVSSIKAIMKELDARKDQDAETHAKLWLRKRLKKRRKEWEAKERAEGLRFLEMRKDGEQKEESKEDTKVQFDSLSPHEQRYVDNANDLKTQAKQMKQTMSSIKDMTKELDRVKDLDAEIHAQLWLRKRMKKRQEQWDKSMAEEEQKRKLKRAHDLAEDHAKYTAKHAKSAKDKARILQAHEQATKATQKSMFEKAKSLLDQKLAAARNDKRAATQALQTAQLELQGASTEEGRLKAQVAIKQAKQRIENAEKRIEQDQDKMDRLKEHRVEAVAEQTEKKSEATLALKQAEEEEEMEAADSDQKKKEKKEKKKEAKKPEKKEVKKPKKEAKKPAQKPAQKPAKKPTKKPTKKPAQKPGQALVPSPQFVKHGRFGLQKDFELASSSQVVHTGEYTYSFWIKPTKKLSGYRNILRKGTLGKGRERGPGIWFYPGRTRLHVRVSTGSGWNTGADPAQDLPIGRWSHVAVTAKAGDIRVFVNGEQKARTQGLKAPSVNSGSLYASANNQASAGLAALRMWSTALEPAQIQAEFSASKAAYVGVDVPAPLLTRLGDVVVKPNQKVAEPEQVAHNGEYTYSFWLRPNSKLSGYRNILRKGDAKKGRERGPGIWFYPGRTRLHVRVSTGNGWNTGADPAQDLPLQRWSHVAVTAKAGDIRVFVNGEQKARKQGLKAPSTNKGALYASAGRNADVDMQDLKVWKRALSPDMVLSDYARAARKYAAMQQRTDAAIKRVKEGNGPRLAKEKVVLKRGQQISAADALPNTGQYSLSFWIRPKATASEWANAFLKGTNGVSGEASPGVWFRPGGTQLHVRSTTSKSRTTAINSKTALDLGRWYHVVVTHMAGRLTLFLNGAEAGRVQGSGLAPKQNDAGLFASDKATPVVANADVQRVRYYVRALPASEVRQLFEDTQKPYKFKPLFVREGDVDLNSKAWQLASGKALKPAATATTFSYTFWLKVAGKRNGVREVLVKGDGARDLAPSVRLLSQDTRLQVRVSDSKAWNRAVTVPAGERLVLGEWTHVAVVGQSNKFVRVYQHGKRVAQYTPAAFKVNEGALRASSGTAKNRPNAKLAELHYYPAALSDADVVADMRQTLGQYQTSRRVLWAANSKFCLHNWEGKADDDNRVDLNLASAKDDKMQSWLFMPDGRVALAADRAYCLTVLGDQLKAGSKVGLFRCGASHNLAQQWNYTGQRMRLQAMNNLCLHLANAQPRVGARAEINVCNGKYNQHQKWNMQSV